MDNQNKNIEDFFNRSMEQYSDAPSDNVWSNIDQMLASEVIPFYQRKMFWAWMISTLLLLLLLGVGYCSMQNSIRELTQNLEKVKSENEGLQLALNNCNKNEESILQGFDNQEGIGSERLGPENQATSKRNEIGALDFEVSFKEKIKHQTADLTERTPSQPSKILPQLTDESLLQIESERGAELEISVPALTKLSTQKIASFKPHQTIQNFIWERMTPLKMKAQKFSAVQIPKYRLGFTTSAIWANTDIDSGDALLGYNSGITNEFRLSNRSSLTIGFSFAESGYELQLNENQQDILKDYPIGNDLPFNIIYIRQQVNYFELPIGFKWYFKEYQNGNKLFLHPSVSFQLYLKQRFGYGAASPFPNPPFTTEEEFDIFNMPRIHIGFENQWRPRLAWQVGAFVESGFTKFGVENRDLFNVGLKGAILFNPKKKF